MREREREREGVREGVKGRIKRERKERTMLWVSGIELSGANTRWYYVERLITTACEGVFRDLVRAREIDSRGT